MGIKYFSLSLSLSVSLQLAAFWFTYSSSGFLCNWKIGHSWKRRQCMEKPRLRYRLPLSAFVYIRSFYILYYYYLFYFLFFFSLHRLIQDRLKPYTPLPGSYAHRFLVFSSLLRKRSRPFCVGSSFVWYANECCSGVSMNLTRVHGQNCIWLVRHKKTHLQATVCKKKC
jgi:hypothetical protein